MDLPGWQALYEELGPKGLEIIAVAQDTGGEAAAGPFYDAAKATYTTLIDTKHTLSALYNMVNVPTGVLIDEEGVIVRFDEGTYSRKYETGNLSFGTDEYVPAVRDWVENGSASSFALAGSALADQLPSRSVAERDADAHFRLASYLMLQGDEEGAQTHWLEAQELHPESWNYHRQDWSFTPAEAGPNWFKKFQALEGKPYYRPMELPGSEEP